MDRLGLTDDEALAVFDADPLSLIAGDLAHRPELRDPRVPHGGRGRARGRPAPAPLAARRRPGRAHPIDLLLAGDFAGFEDALAGLLERGLVLGGRGDGSAGLTDSTDGVGDRTAGL